MQAIDFESITKPLAARIIVRSGTLRVVCDEIISTVRQHLLQPNLSEAETIEAKKAYLAALDFAAKIQDKMQSLADSDKETPTPTVHMDS